MIGNSDWPGWVKSVQCMESVEVELVNAELGDSEQSNVACYEKESKWERKDACREGDLGV